jgi:hypothetical protein
MNKTVLACLVSISLLLAACGDERQPVHEEEFIPELRSFNMIDSYDVDTATSNAPLALSPYEYDGLFEIFWKVNSLENYRVSLKINDRDTPSNSITIGSTVCGAGLVCDQSGNWVCEYTEDLFMNCDTSVKDVDIEPLFNVIPKKVYLLLEICDIDSNYCEFDSYPVTME